MRWFDTWSEVAVRRSLGALATAIAAGLAYATWGLRAWNGRHDVGQFLALFGGLFVLYLLAASLVRRLPSGNRQVLAGIFTTALIFRLLLLPAGLLPDSRYQAAARDLSSTEVGFSRFLLYDQDVWRYLWDGHVLAAGQNPYRYTPNEWEELAFDDHQGAAELLQDDLWLEIFENIAYRDFLTVYPPLAQGFFALLHSLAPGSVLLLKAALIALDLLACWLLYRLLLQLGRRPEGVLLYAWNPLVLKEIAGSGHVDGLVVPLLLAAVLAMLGERRRLALVLLGSSILAKLTPVVLAGLFLRHSRWREWPVLAVTVALGYLPFVASWRQILQALGDFGSGWTFNPGAWLLARSGFESVFPGHGAKLASGLWALTTLGVLLWLIRRPAGSERSLARSVYLLLVVFLLLSPTFMPWYLIWALPFAIASNAKAWPFATGLALLSYLIYIDGVERAWWLAIEHSAIWCLLAWDCWRWARPNGPRP